MRFKAAVIQLNAGPDVTANLHAAASLIRAAAKDGAILIQTPENTCRMRAKLEDKLAASFDENGHPAIPFFSALAKELGVTLIIGSLSSIRAEGGKLANRSYVFAKDGTIAARYDKIHMFDVDLPNGDKYRESDSNRAGDRAVIAACDGLRIGLSVCYDLRFPHLYRRLAHDGADILSIPAAFTVPTGQAHWEVLLRARAIENGAFLLAAAQTGEHEGGRRTYGHSMIVAPWGEILAQVEDDAPGYALAEIDLEQVEKARNAVPSLRHDRVLVN